MLSVLKIGGSVLRDEASYATTAGFLRDRLAAHHDERLVVIVSAQYGATDELLAEAQAIVAGANSIHPQALDLLWSTGELRSVSRLTLHLHRAGVSATPFNVHQTGLCADGEQTRVRPFRLLAALAVSRVVIVPGFLGVGAGDAITSLGRGGSDLTAVLLAAAIDADACELIKDVPGYFTADPHRDTAAAHLQEISIAEALAMADAGCDLVQRAALAAAAEAGVPLVIRSLDARASVTHVHPSISRTNRSRQHGVLDQDDSRRTAVRA